MNVFGSQTLLGYHIHPTVVIFRASLFEYYHFWVGLQQKEGGPVSDEILIRERHQDLVLLMCMAWEVTSLVPSLKRSY